jgi:HSP20 family protein
MTRIDDGDSGFPSLRGQVESFFDEVLGQRPRRGAPLDFWNPHLDLVEEADRYVVEMDLPGVRLEDILVEVEGRNLHISGRREIVRETEGPRFRQRERYHGTFRRSVELRQPVDRDRVSARLEEGILRVELPKKGARP